MATKRATSGAKRRTEKPPAERRIDEALEETFPASDPPFFVGGVVRPGPAESDSPPETEGEQRSRRDKH
jgi:hypothetical protein